MDYKHIEIKAKKLKKYLICGLTSFALIGSISGCSVQSKNVSQIKHQNLSHDLTTISFSSKSLDHFLSSSDNGFGSSAMMVFPTFNVTCPTLIFHNHNVGVYDNIPDERPYMAGYVSSYNYNDGIHYRINNHKQTLTIFKPHESKKTKDLHPAFNGVVYKLVSEHNQYNIRHPNYVTYNFIPIKIRRINRSYHHVPYSFGKHNMIHLKDFSRLKLESHHKKYMKKIRKKYALKNLDNNK